jgi:hypothetical protein
LPVLLSGAAFLMLAGLALSAAVSAPSRLRS